jgi:hypothetical protein
MTTPEFQTFSTVKEKIDSAIDIPFGAKVCSSTFNGYLPFFFMLGFFNFFFSSSSSLYVTAYFLGEKQIWKCLHEIFRIVLFKHTSNVSWNLLSPSSLDGANQVVETYVRWRTVPEDKKFQIQPQYCGAITHNSNPQINISLCNSCVW